MLSQDPKNLVEFDHLNNAIEVNDRELDLFREPTLKLSEWKPEREIQEYRLAKKIYLDIETIGGLDPVKGRVIAVGMLFDNGIETDCVLISDEDEEKILRKVVSHLGNTTADMVIGHNLHNFDLPWLAYRCSQHNIKHPFTPGKRSTRVTASSFLGKPLEVTQWYLKRNKHGQEIAVIDTFIQACVFDKSAAILPNYRLKDVAIAIKARPEKRLELDFLEIQECWEKGDVEPILEYLKYDLEDTKSLADYFLPVIWYQQLVVPNVSLQYLSVCSPAFKWQKIAENFYGGYSGVADEKMKYKGALTACNPGLYKNAYKIDVSSMYPSILLRYELYSKSDRNKELLRVMRYLMNRRFELKALYKETGEEIYNQQQGALKILINGGYGFFGTGGYGFNDMAVAALVTAYGRRLLTLMCETLEHLGIQVIETDTDGIICCGGDPKEAFNAVQSALPEGIDIDLDYVETHIYVPKPKSYMLFSGSKIKKVGLFRKRNRSLLELDFCVDFVQAYLCDREKAHELYRETAIKLVKGEFNVDKLKYTKKIPKSDKMITGAGLGQIGEKVTYYFGSRFSGRTWKRYPVVEGDYFVKYYIKQFNKLYVEMVRTIEGEDPEELITEDWSDLQLSLFV